MPVSGCVCPECADFLGSLLSARSPLAPLTDDVACGQIGLAILELPRNLLKKAPTHFHCSFVQLAIEILHSFKTDQHTIFDFYTAPKHPRLEVRSN